MAQPGLVIPGMGVESEEGRLGGFRVGLGPAEPGVGDPAVVGHHVQDQAHPALGQSPPQAGQRRVPAQVGVHVVVVGHVVLMVAGGREDGVQVDGRDAQVLQVVQVLDDPGEVAPMEVPRSGAGPREVVPGPSPRRPALNQVLPVPDVAGRVPVSEAVREDLVDDRVGHPFGAGVSGHQAEVGGVGGSMPRNPGPGEPPVALVCLHQEAIGEARHGQRHLGLPPLADRVPAGQAGRGHHLLALRGGAQEDRVDRQVAVGAQGQGHGLPHGDATLEVGGGRPMVEGFQHGGPFFPAARAPTAVPAGSPGPSLYR